MRDIAPHAKLWPRQPWKNGRGITYEILRDPRGTRDYDLRVSVALVADSGPFSSFPGYRRHTFLVGPAPVRLETTTSTELVAVGDHVSLLGEAALAATLLAGPTWLCNVLVRTELVATGALVVGYGPTAKPVQFTLSLVTYETERYRVAKRIDASDCVWIA